MRLDTLLLSGLLAGCDIADHSASANSGLEAPSAPDFSAISVAPDSEKCVAEEVAELKGRMPDLDSKALTPENSPIPFVNIGQLIQLTSAFNSIEEGQSGSEILGNLGSAFYREESGGPLKAQWQSACSTARPEDFYRSAYLLMPTFGPEGFARCIPADKRCGDF